MHVEGRKTLQIKAILDLSDEDYSNLDHLLKLLSFFEDQLVMVGFAMFILLKFTNL